MNALAALPLADARADARADGFAERFAAEARTTLASLARPCLAFAVLPATGLVACTAAPQLLRSVNPASADVLLALIALPMWSALMLAGGGSLLAGRLDRWIGSRAVQALLLLATVTALCMLSAHGATLKDPASEWLAYLLPPLAVLAGGWLLWPSRRGIIAA